MFGGITEENTKIKMLGNNKHRETGKDKLKILDITKNMDLQEYRTKLQEILNNIKNSIIGAKDLIGIPVYIAINEKQELKGLQVCNLNIETVINQCNNNEINLYKIKLKENTKVIYFSNIIYYDNYNKTLPLGMNVTEECLVDFDMYKLKQINKDDFRIISLQDEFKINTKKIYLHEYELEEKS